MLKFPAKKSSKVQGPAHSSVIGHPNLATCQVEEDDEKPQPASILKLDEKQVGSASYHPKTSTTIR